MTKFSRTACTLGFLLPAAIAAFAAFAQESEAPSADTAAPAAEAAAPAAAPAAAAPKKNFRRSKLTSDESEGLADRRRLLLATGEDRAVDLDFEVNGGANGIAIGNQAVVATTLVKIGEKRQIIFKPLKAGETTVTIRDNDGSIRLIFTVRVTGSNVLRQAAEIRGLLKDIEGLDIKVVGQKIVVDGEVLVPADYGRMLTVIGDGAYKDVVLNLTTLSTIALQMLSKRIQEDINTFAPNVRTRVVNGLVFLEGTVDNMDQAKRAAEVAKLYLPEAKPGNAIIKGDAGAQIMAGRALVQNFIVINPPPPKKQEKLVRITVHYVELAKDYSKVFGFKWQPGFTADPQITIGATQGGSTGSSGTSFTATISSLIPKLSSAQSAGYARVLKTATVIVRSGQQATLEDQRKIPITVIGQNGQGTGGTADVGITLAVTPQILGQSEDIQMELKMGQAAPVGRVIAGSAPIVATHKVDTRIYVKSNESAAVAGVNSSDIGTDFNKDDPSPGSFEGQTSPLFSLLHSKAYRKGKSQFVIFVTPQIIDNASEGTEDLKKNFRVKVK
jgi:pilus assembly protein CpaC